MNTLVFPRRLTASFFLGFALCTVWGRDTYQLNHVDGIESFGGSAEAQALLATNGFVVAAPDFRQIFEPYIESPLPVYITPDSAWHTYHFLLEHGVKEMEQGQSERLAAFSRRLLAAASEQANADAGEWRELERYASVGLAFQDAVHATNLPDADKELVKALSSGSEPVHNFTGFPLSPVNFRPQSFYAESPELSAYYRARQWYANVDFRLSEESETRLALYLSWLVQRDPELRQLWQELTQPYDRMLALPEDATVSDYYQATTNICGAEIGTAEIKKRGAEIMKKLRAAPRFPKINDQQLSPQEYEHYSQVTAGFRLLPARQLPCAICFQNCVDPKIHGRFCPSGLDFFAGSEALRSAAAVRAEKREFGKKVLDVVMKSAPGPMPDSLYGESMTLLATLQQPLPPQVPAPLRTTAWGDLQLWTQLGAWAEQRHTWALHAKPNAEFLGLAETPPGIVAPYPDFFLGLAKLSRQTAAALAANEVAESFDPQRMAAEILRAQEKTRSNTNVIDMSQAPDPVMERYWKFLVAYQGKFPQLPPRDVDEDMLKRCEKSGPTNDSEREILRLFYDSAPPTISTHLNDFAAVCDRLAGLARKELAGEIPTAEEAQWISGYGITLAGLHFYSGNSWLEPQDDFPIASRIFDSPIKDSVLYAGVARPEAIYVILPYKNRLQLYRGAVMSYREFERPEGEPLDDAAWLAMVREGKTPAPPAFTASFLCDGPPGPEQTNRIKSLSFAEEDLAKPDLSRRVKLKIKTTVMAPAPAVREADHESLLMSSDDERHVIYIENKNGKVRLVRDGAPGKDYDAVEGQWFSPDSKHVVYLARDQGKFLVVKDEVEGKRYAKIEPIFPEEAWCSFSSNSEHFAYAATLESGQQCMVVDGVEGPAYNRIVPGTFLFSETSGHFAYAAIRRNQGWVIKDNQEVVAGDAGGWDGNKHGPFLSADGARLACMVRRGGQWFVNVDGKETGPWYQIGNLGNTGFSADGKHFAYSVSRDNQMYRMLDGKEMPGWSIEGTVFSPNGTNWASVQEDDTGTCVVVNGVPGKKYRGGILEVTFSPDGSRLGYFVEGIPPSVVLHGEQEIENFEPQLFTGIRFSPDSKHVAISGKRGHKAVVIVDGKQYPSADDPESSGSEVVFSPDSQRWAYPAFRGNRIYWIVSGVEYGPYGSAPNPNHGFDEPWSYEESSLYFSPDSRHFAFRTTREGHRYLVVDGFELEILAEWFPHSSIVFDSAAKLHFVVIDQKNIDLVEAEIVSH